MSEELDLLREIGAQKISEDTHIPLQHVQSVIHESFEDLTKIQFLGFISILEREYNQELSALKAKGLEYFKAKSLHSSEQHSVFVEPKRVKKPTLIYIIVVFFVFMIVAFISVQSTEDTEVIEEIDNSAIEKVQQKLPPIIVDENSSELSSKVDENLTLQEDEKIVPSLSIIPKSKLWIGYINRDEEIKKQKIIKKTLVLDPSKEWLLSLGHGNVDVEINGELQEFKSRKNVRFFYKDGELKQLTLRDFKILNEGRIW
ncbi:MAG: hypothetical protein U9Q40_07245 [Campylobacterota bacterium]|nr:hypothetical protein [Campylobacterota bacterium]